MFAHTPKLHTFLLSDAPMRAADYKSGVVGKLRWLEEWDEHPNALKKVAFSTEEGVWTKTDDGWQAPPRNEDSDDEDDDDEDEDEDEDDGAAESDGSVIVESS